MPLPLVLYRALMREGTAFARLASIHGHRVGEELRALGDANGFDTVLRLQSYVDRVTSGGNNVLVAPKIIRDVLRGMFEANRTLTTEEASPVLSDGFATLRFFIQRKKAFLSLSKSTTSDTSTGPCRIRVSSFNVPEQSYPTEGLYMFGYNVSISNESETDTIQVVKRHWNIYDNEGVLLDSVKGPGIVGKCPVLTPGSKFDYSSGCPLHAESGSMAGYFSMLNLTSSSEFQAKIDPFRLTIDKGRDRVIDTSVEDGADWK